jgi:hypothetical protein
MEKLRLTWVYGTANLIGQQAKNMETPENKLAEIPAAPQPPVKFQPVKFVHERSPQFTTYHADGGWGVVSGDGDIHLNFFSEYPKLATGVIHQVYPESGVYTGEYKMQGFPDPDYHVVMREFQCSVVLSVETAERLRGLIDSFIKIAKKQLDDQKARMEQKK